MSDTEYTPTAEQVETAYSHDPEDEYRDPVGYGYRVNENRRGFRRWLAQHEAAIRRDQILKDAQIAKDYAEEAREYRDNQTDYPESWTSMQWHGMYHGANDVAIRLRAQIGDTNE